jgi:hypothetical protein
MTATPHRCAQLRTNHKNAPQVKTEAPGWWLC